jgi:hypothetical protein
MDAPGALRSTECRGSVCSRLSQFFVAAPGHLTIVERSPTALPFLTQSADHKDLGG